MNLQLTNTEEWVDGAFTDPLGEVLIRFVLFYFKSKKKIVWLGVFLCGFGDGFCFGGCCMNLQLTNTGGMGGWSVYWPTQ